MDLTSLNNRNDSYTSSIAEDIESLIPAVQQFSDDQSESQAYMSLANAVTRELIRITERNEDYAEARKVIQAHQNRIALFNSLLSETLTKLERLEQARARHEEYSSRWWEQTFQTLQEAFEKNPEIAYQRWIKIIAKSLVDWELEAFSRLVNATFSHPRDKFPYVLLTRHGNESLQRKDYPAALEMLNYLTGQLSEVREEDVRLLGAQLLIFIGRIHLYQLNEPEAARRAFDRSSTLAPHDGRPLAALGCISLEQGEDGLAEANRLFARAVELSPDQPEPYVGKAIIAEKRKLWNEADEWYKTAVQESLDERNPLVFLSKMLAPGSGRLYFQLARQLQSDKMYAHALTAVEYCLELGLEDDTSYPTRAAIALMAEILFAMSASGRTVEEAKTIADHYFLAGKYYYWNDEFQRSLDLLKISHDLDETNALVLFYLADDLRILSRKLTFPYADDKLVHESLAAWEMGIKLLETAVTSDLAWVYVARSMIALQLARLSGGNKLDHVWQAVVFMERALLLKEEPLWWTFLSNAYNWEGLALYANILYLLQKASRAWPDDVFTLEEQAKVLINTGQYEEANLVLDKLLRNENVTPETRSAYLSWQATGDYYQGKYSKALENLSSILKQEPNNIWAMSLRANIYRSMGKDQEALQDELLIWDRRNDPNYATYEGDFAWAAFRQGIFQEALDRIRPFLNSIDTDIRVSAQLLSGLSCLGVGDFQRANDLLSLALETCDNPRVLSDLSTEFELFQRRASQEQWPLSSTINSYFNKPDSILKLVKLKQKEIKAYQIDPIIEWEKVLSNPMTGNPGSSSWMAAQFGLGRIYLDTNNLDAAEKAYQALSLNSQPIPGANIGLNKVQERR